MADDPRDTFTRGDEETEEEFLHRILDQNPFHEDRLEILTSCVVNEVDHEQRLSDAQRAAMFGELCALTDRYEILAFEADRKAN